MIPRIIHFVWIGGQLPGWAARNIAEFHRLNPEHEIRIHGEEALLPELAAAYAAAVDNSSRADLIRYSVLSRFGGWYFDVDFWPLRPVADAEQAWNLGGSRLFVSKIQHNKNARLPYANGVLACGAGCNGIQLLVETAAAVPAEVSRTTFGPGLVGSVIKENRAAFVIGEAAWFFPVTQDEVFTAYRHLLCGDEGNIANRPGTGGTRPFAAHLWAHDFTDELRDAIQATTGNPKPFAVVAESCRTDHPLARFSEGLETIGFEVMRTSKSSDIFAQWSSPSVIVCWNGMKDEGLPKAAERLGVPCIRLEHGFFDRHNYSQADHKGFLHWASWAYDVAGIAPEGSRERLDHVAPARRLMRPRKDGYILAIGQVEGDTQMLNSEISGGVPLQTYIKRNLPDGVTAYYRPHPLSKYAPNPVHELLPTLPASQGEADIYRTTHHGAGLADALAGAAFVVTVNSNSIVEALCAGVPCMAFGPHTAINAGVVKATSLATLAADLRYMLNGWAPDQWAVDNYLQWLAARQWSGDELAGGEVVRWLLARAGVGGGND